MAQKFYKDENIIGKIEDGVFFIIFFGNLITLDIVVRGIELRKEMTEGKTYPILGDIREAKMFTRDARARLAERDGGENVSKVAILVNSKAQEVVFNFFATINKAPAPAKLFTNEEKALEWLKKE